MKIIIYQFILSIVCFAGQTADNNSGSGIDIKTNACAAYELTKISHPEVNNNPSYERINSIVQANDS